ncbi:MAG: redoxin domain-containing protein [Verrucomicrobiota bacterium JB023]|nr:redoxin domain-containing protein [Verrucomicrobiota bacterium JB023]
MKLLLPAFFAFASVSLFAQEEVKTLSIGAEAPSFTLPGTDGQDHSLSDFSEAKALVVVFTCNHCPDARAARDKVKTIHADYQDDGVALIAISGNDEKALRLDEIGYSVYGDSFEDMKKVAEEENYQFPYLYDGEKQDVSRAYGAVSTPHVFVFDADRKLTYTGRIDDARRKTEETGRLYLREAIEATLKGEKPATETTRPFGCSTKWSYKRDSVTKANERWAALPVTLSELTEEGAKELAKNETDKLRVINFWATTCGPCVAEFPDLIETYRRFQTRDFELITISTDPVDEKAKVESFLKKQQAALSPRTVDSVKEEGRESNNYLYTGDNLDKLAEAIDADWNGALPHTVIIAPGGEIVWSHTGKFDPVELRRAIVKGLE